MSKANDLKLTKLCAEAMGYKTYVSKIGILFVKDYYPKNVRPRDCPWNPLNDRCQAMELVEKLLLNITCYPDFVDGHQWIVTSTQNIISDDEAYAKNNLNRAIVECVANMQKLNVCPNKKKMGKFACKDKTQCWEECGELGHSEEYMRVAPEFK